MYLYIKDVPILLLVSTGARSTFFFLIADIQLVFNTYLKQQYKNYAIMVLEY